MQTKTLNKIQTTNKKPSAYLNNHIFLNIINYEYLIGGILFFFLIPTVIVDSVASGTGWDYLVIILLLQIDFG